MKEERCRDCPWKGAGRVLGPREKRKGAIMALVAEGPAREELARGDYLVGSSGIETDKTLARAGVGRDEVAVGNAFWCWKPKGATQGEEKRAVEGCRERLREFLAEVQPKTVLMMGGKALRSICPGFVAGRQAEGLLRHAGSIWSRKEVEAANEAVNQESILPESVKWVTATIHPAAIIRREKLDLSTAMSYRLLPALHIRRLLDCLRKGRKLLPVEMRYGAPDWLDEGFVFDLEGRQRPEWVGVQRLEGGPVFGGPWRLMEEWVRRAFKQPVMKVGHNIGGWDLPMLLREGVEVKPPYRDTMTMAGTCEPDLPRGLYFQNNLYFGHRRPYWKELETDNKLAEVALRAAWRATGMLDPRHEEGWLQGYNAIDVDGDRRIYDVLIERARKEGWL